MAGLAVFHIPYEHDSTGVLPTSTYTDGCNETAQTSLYTGRSNIALQSQKERENAVSCPLLILVRWIHVIINFERFLKCICRFSNPMSSE
jgi:hypothetical protein